MMSCTSIPAYAQTNESADPGTTEEKHQEETQPEEDESLPPLTPEGNMTLVDDITSEKTGKQFITVVSKNGNYFYIIIDRDDQGENTVHFLNTVDESDLLALMDDKDAQAILDAEAQEEAEKTAAEQAAKEQAEKEAAEAASQSETTPEVKERKPINWMPAAVCVMLAGIGVVGFFAIRMKKKTQKTDQQPDPDADYHEDDDGYDLPEDTDDETEEAEVVKRIFREYLEGSSYYQIGHSLEKDGIKTAAGSDRWLATTLRKILMNEKYMGDALLQKTVTTDFLTKKRVQNHGIAPQWYVEDSHPAIIPKDIFMRVQEEIVRRAHLETSTGKRRIYSGKYALSSIVYCAHCGDFYQRTHWNIRGKKKIVWRCVSRLHKKDNDLNCTARTVPEELLHEVVVRAINQAFSEKDAVLPILKQNIEKALTNRNSGRIAEIDAELEKQQKELLRQANAKKEFNSIAVKIEELRDEKHRLRIEDANTEGVKERIKEMEEFLDGLSGEIHEYDEEYVRRLIERITVDDDHFTVEFKSGLETVVEA